MKSTITILSAALTLQAGILVAGNDNIAPVSNERSMITLAPATPVEATFEDVVTINLIDLMPVMPSEATFEEIPELMSSTINLSPETPAVADFEDVIEIIADNGILVPVTPTEADFE